MGILGGSTGRTGRSWAGIVDHSSPRAQAAALARHITDTIGPVETWALPVKTTSGKQYVVYPPSQSPGVTHQILLDAAHSLSCSGCDRCRQAAAG